MGAGNGSSFRFRIRASIARTSRPASFVSVFISRVAAVRRILPSAPSRIAASSWPASAQTQPLPMAP
jgi:hypothetical protein